MHVDVKDVYVLLAVATVEDCAEVKCCLYTRRLIDFDSEMMKPILLSSVLCFLC